jgi:pimeloyl-ACP methyl ester carboxylesterase
MAAISRRWALAMAAASLLGARRASAKGAAIDESGFVAIGGIDQWIAIQGEDVGNPAILFLHGGPGDAQSPFLSEFRPWEHWFTVVNWDQRGTGKTYGRNGPTTPDMTLDRVADDAIEVADHACRRLSKTKVVLVGHSWGAGLGLNVIKKRPELFYAYVGTGQPVTWARVVQGQEAWARQQALAANDQATLKALDETAALPVTDGRRISAPSKYQNSPSDLDYQAIQDAFTGQPPYPTKGDVADWIGGHAFSGARLAPAIFGFDARALGLDIPIPFFVIEGCDDHTVSVDAARAYVAEVRAPKKAFVLIDGGHSALFTDPDQFVAALRRYVRPLAR